MTPFAKGDRVRHRINGSGVVAGFDNLDPTNVYVQFDHGYPSHPRYVPASEMEAE